MPRKTKIQIWKHNTTEAHTILISKKFSIYISNDTVKIMKWQPSTEYLTEWQKIAEN